MFVSVAVACDVSEALPNHGVTAALQGLLPAPPAAWALLTRGQQSLSRCHLQLVAAFPQFMF